VSAICSLTSKLVFASLSAEFSAFGLASLHTTSVSAQAAPVANVSIALHTTIKWPDMASPSADVPVQCCALAPSSIWPLLPQVVAQRPPAVVGSKNTPRRCSSGTTVLQNCSCMPGNVVGVSGETGNIRARRCVDNAAMVRHAATRQRR
jgi:hypothetical protein